MSSERLLFHAGLRSSDDVQAARQRRITEDLLSATIVWPDRGDHRLLWVDELHLRPRKRSSKATNGAARLLHGYPRS